MSRVKLAIASLLAALVVIIGGCMPGPIRLPLENNADVLFTSTFDDGITEMLFTTGTVASDTTMVDTGSRSIKLTTAAALNAVAGIGRGWDAPQYALDGVVVTFRPQTDTASLILLLAHNNGDTTFDQLRVECIWTGAGTTLKYVDSAGVAQTFATLNYNLFYTLASHDAFSVAKLVGDFSTPGTSAYVYFYLNGAVYPLDGIAGRNLPAANNFLRLDAIVQVRADSAAAKNLNIGRFTLTANESVRP